MNLTNKFILLILFITALIVSVFTYIQINEQQEILKNGLQQRVNLMRNNLNLNAKHIINTLKYDVENDIASFNFSNIDVSFHKLLRNKNISAINMHSIDKNINLYSGDTSFQKDIHIDDIKKLEIIEIKNGNNFIISTPINFSTKWGTLHIVYSLSDLKKEILEEEQLIIVKIQKSITKAIYTSIIFAFFIILLTYLLTRKFFLPILLLTEIAKQIANGKMNVNNEFENIKRDDEIGILYDTFKDMSTKLESSYKKLNKVNDDLEAKVITRTKQLNLEKQKAEDATKIKSEFLATMSHEIRTPMNGILGMSYLTLQTTLNEQQKDYVVKIEKSAKSLMRIINDILDFSKLEASKLTITNSEFNLLELIQSTVNILKIEADKKYQNSLKYNIINKYFNADSFRISQILTNIIGNAIKFTDKGEIKINITNPSSNIYRFTISDSGIGLTKDEISKLFQSFSQADSSTTRKHGGTGLGLVISKQLAELMNGKIWIESTKKDIGSIFYVELKLKVSNTQKSTVKELENNSKVDINTLSNTKILLVEDNKINQEIIIGLLENSSIQVDIANNGVEAIKKFNANIHKIILMDIEMPIMNGIEATKLIRETNESIPIIALTANAMVEDISRSEEVGMNEHLNKPIDIEKLHNILDKYLSKKPLEPQIPQFKYINSITGLSYINKNKKLYVKILKDFYDNYKELDFDALNHADKEREIHTLKGLSANIGATDLHNIIKEFELSENKDSTEKIKSHLEYVIEDLKDIEQEKTFQTVPYLELCDELRDQLFRELYNVIEQKKPKLCSAIVNKIEKYKLNNQDSRMFTEIKKEIKQYNFKKANNLLSQILS